MPSLGHLGNTIQSHQGCRGQRTACLPPCVRVRWRSVAAMMVAFALLTLPVVTNVHGVSSTPNTTMAQSFLGHSLDRLASKVRRPSSPGTTEAASAQGASAQYFAIRVVDAATGRGIPLVYLRTTFKAIYVTDSAGYVAFHEPGLMTGRTLWVTVSSYGYASPTGFLGVPGTPVHPTPGGEAEIRLERTQIAERLYRMTGVGIYRDSWLLGKPAPIEKPVLNADVAGSDTIQCARYKGKLVWMWQDTDQMAFALGNFKMTGATTELPERLDAARGLDFRYYTVDDEPTNFARAMVDIPLEKDGSFPIWVDGLTVVPDRTGRARLLARYAAVDHAMRTFEEGLALWNDSRELLERLALFRDPDSDKAAPTGHAVYLAPDDDDGGSGGGLRYAFYGKNVRVKADYESASDPAQYEAFTCLSRDGKRAQRTPSGELAWKWEKGGVPVFYGNTERLVREGVMRRSEAPYQLIDADTGEHVVVAQASVAWNPYLGLWVNIVQQNMGATVAGEIWFATAASPLGPWRLARKVATHHMDRDGYRVNHNDFYNPVQHSELMQERGRFVYFSGTFVNTFSGNPWATPYYGYNNIMYRLDVSDERLQLPPPPEGLWRARPSDL